MDQLNDRISFLLLLIPIDGVKRIAACLMYMNLEEDSAQYKNGSSTFSISLSWRSALPVSLKPLLPITAAASLPDKETAAKSHGSTGYSNHRTGYSYQIGCRRRYFFIEADGCNQKDQTED